MLSAALLVLLLPGGCDDKIRPAATALQNNDLTTAVAILTAERGNCTQSPWFFELTGVAARLSGNLNEAEQAFKRAVSIDPKSAPLLADLGGVGGGPFAFSLHGHTGRMALMNCTASPAEVKLT